MLHQWLLIFNKGEADTNTRVFKKTISLFFRICSGKKSLFGEITVFTKTDERLETKYS